MADIKRFAIALGYFDGLHKGHRRLIAALKERAAARGLEPRVFTFGDDFFPCLGKDTKLVYTLAERRSILTSLGTEAIVPSATAATLRQTGEKFVQGLHDLGASLIITGADYRFGKNASCGAAELKAYANALGIDAETVPTELTAGEKISASAIRLMLVGGEIARANEQLADPYFIGCTVHQGRGQGAKHGVPTANILFPAEKLVPKHGVYVSSARISGVTYPALTNIGGQPTFGQNLINAETHIPGFSGCLYGQEVRVSLHEYIRPVFKFQSPADLVAQIQKDIDYLNNYIKSKNNEHN